MFKNKLSKYIIIRFHNLKSDTYIAHIEPISNLKKETVSKVIMLLKWHHEINDNTVETRET
jgi:hypothetical protein